VSLINNLIGIVRSGVGTPGLPIITVNKPQISEDIQFFTLIQANELMNYEFKLLDVALIKKGCEIIKAPYIGGGTFWVKRTDNLAEEELAVKESISKEIWKGVKAIVVFSKLDKNHPRYSYFQAIAIRSEDLLDLKKALKIHKLKAFL
jgi:hypothetical protein